MSFFVLIKWAWDYVYYNRVVPLLPSPQDTPPTQDSIKEEIIKKRKIKYIIGMIWWQFRKKRVKRRLFERIRASETHG